MTTSFIEIEVRVDASDVLIELPQIGRLICLSNCPVPSPLQSECIYSARVRASHDLDAPSFEIDIYIAPETRTFSGKLQSQRICMINARDQESLVGRVIGLRISSEKKAYSLQFDAFKKAHNNLHLPTGSEQ